MQSIIPFFKILLVILIHIHTNRILHVLFYIWNSYRIHSDNVFLFFFFYYFYCTFSILLFYNEYVIFKQKNKNCFTLFSQKLACGMSGTQPQVLGRQIQRQGWISGAVTADLRDQLRGGPFSSWGLALIPGRTPQGKCHHRH